MEKTETQFQQGAKPFRYHIFKGEATELVEGGVIAEQYLSLYVNGQELATIMSSPIEQEVLALGFLYNEGVIESMQDVGWIQRNVAGTVVDVLLNHSDFEPPRRLIITSGCSGGITTQDLTENYPALSTDFSTTPDVILERMRDLQSAARLYKLVRGVHTAILADVGKMLLSAEDVGRHNTIDKLAGKALQENISTRDCILLSSGRISSEMLSKARRMGVPVVVSRTAPTSMSLELAELWKICIVGYARRGSLRIYTNPQRLQLAKIS